MARKKKAPASNPGAPLWLATYGDMVTLVLCFFVLLYAFSTLDVAKFTAMAESMQMAFSIMPGGPAASSTQSMVDGSFGEGAGDAARRTQSDQTNNANKVLALVQEAIKQEDLGDDIRVSLEERGIVISFSEQILFAEGSARIRPVSLRVLYKIGMIINSLSNQIELEGHTDSAVLQNSIYVDNWGLSAARAAAVVSYLNREIGISEKRLRAVGLGPARPDVPNNSEGNMALNRRVDMVILSQHSIK
ncbi:MAG: OmpA family protein [Synergistaceae bacterium]|jgi:chemotaxis protein MotB|nr:OmpA family protein [Synergistaceae bacterium]